MFDPDPPEACHEAVRAVLAGDTGRFTALVERHRDRVFRFVLRHVGDRVAAEDLAQDAFLEAFRRLHTFRGESRFSTWLLGIALNLSRNYVNRDRPKQARHTSLDVVAERRDGAPDPAEAAGRGVTLEVLRGAMARLGADLHLAACEACRAWRRRSVPNRAGAPSAGR